MNVQLPHVKKTYFINSFRVKPINWQRSLKSVTALHGIQTNTELYRNLGASAFLHKTVQFWIRSCTSSVMRVKGHVPRDPWEQARLKLHVPKQPIFTRVSAIEQASIQSRRKIFFIRKAGRWVVSERQCFEFPPGSGRMHTSSKNVRRSGRGHSIGKCLIF